MRISDWSSDVCSSDLERRHLRARHRVVDGLCGAAGLHQVVAAQLGQVLGECRLAEADQATEFGDRMLAHGQVAEHGKAALVAHRLQERARFAGGLEGRSIRHKNETCPRSEEHTSELQSLMRISYAVFC